MIKFLDLKKVNQTFESAFKQKMEQFLEGGWYILGKEVKLFEESFAQYCGAKHCIGVGNGLDALVLILKANIHLGKIQKGDEVIVPSNTYIATILAVLEADLVPVLVEPRLETYNLNPDLIEAKITSKTKAILPVHLYGQLCEMEAINKIAQKNNLLIIEDAAQSHGSKFNNQQSAINNLKSASAYSFYPGKNLGALGDAGAITTNDDELAEVLFSLRNYGSKVKYENELIGNQRNSINVYESDLKDVYNSRTFCLYEDIEKLKEMGLAKGGSLDNAVVVKDKLILNEEGLRNKKEFVNHKILDCMGDLYLAGYKIIGKVICSQGGHKLTNQLLRKVFDDKKNFSIFEIKEKNIPHFTINKTSLKSIA